MKKNTNSFHKLGGFRIRDNTEVLELLILSNLEAINTYLIKCDTDQEQRLEILTEVASHQ